MTLDSLPDIYSSDNRCAPRMDRLQTNQLKKNGHDIDGTTSRKLLAKTPNRKKEKKRHSGTWHVTKIYGCLEKETVVRPKDH